eukprot:196069-Pelagomonas_calceolata.AAC.1
MLDVFVHASHRHAHIAVRACIFRACAHSAGTNNCCEPLARGEEQQHSEGPAVISEGSTKSTCC